MTIEDTIHEIRNSIGHQPLNGELTADPASWSQLCHGLDGVADAWPPVRKLEHLNAMCLALRRPAVDVQEGEDVMAAVEAGLAAIQADLEDRVNARRVANPERLLDLLGADLGYPLEKLQSGIRAVMEGSDGADRALGSVWGVNLLRQRLDRFLELLLAKGYIEEHQRHDVDDAIYIVERARAVLNGSSDIVPRDAYLLALLALPKLLGEIRVLATEIDEVSDIREPGWG